MNNSKTPKIVVGVGLAAVYAVGLTIVTLRNAPGIAQDAAVEAAAQVGVEPSPPAAIVSEPIVASSVLSEQPAAVTEMPAPVASTTTSKPEAAPRAGDSIGSNARSMEPAVATAPRAQTSDIEMPNLTGEVAKVPNVDNESANSTSDTPSAEDGEIEPAQ